MLNRDKCEKYIEKEILKIISSTEKCNEIYDYMKDNHNIPRSISSDYISMRMSLVQASDFILFCLVESIEHVMEIKSTELDKLFTMQEVKTYRTSNFEVDTIKFPIRFKVIQVTDDQWVGRIDTKMLMKLRAAQLINYNVNAQRTMQKMVKGGKEIYRITIDQSTVNAIYDLMIKGEYISTPFTFNIPQDSDADFYYDEDKGEMVVKSIEHFDIADGYHRYVSSCKASDEDENFNYKMELRIINFSDDKVKQFIFQQDQKTKMRKIDSNSFNMNKAANIVVNRLNENTQSNLKGLIGRNQCIINFGELADLINYFYFKGVTKDKEKSTIIAVTRDLMENFNMITEYSSNYLERGYTYKQLVAVMCTFYYCEDKNMICNIIDKVVEETEKLDNTKFVSKVPKKSMMNDIERIIKEAK